MSSYCRKAIDVLTVFQYEHQLSFMEEVYVRVIFICIITVYVKVKESFTEGAALIYRSQHILRS